MAISRPLLVVLIGALVLLAATTAVRALGSGGAGAPPATQTAASGAPGGADASATRAPKPEAPAPARQTAAKEARKAAKADDPQSRVLRALASRQVVVLFFGQSRGADDQATRRAVSALERKRDNIAVFTASIKDVSDYARVVASLGIQQSPSTVVIDRRGQARLVQGFLDAGSLRQLVADARS